MSNYRISATTGEIGAGAGWLRLKANLLGLSVPSLWIDQDELPANLTRLGFATTWSVMAGLAPVPTLGICVDVSTRYDIDIYPVPDKQDIAHRVEPQRIAGAVFDDPHPDEWWDAVHEDGNLIVIVGNTHEFRHSWAQAFDRAMVGDAPLVVRMWPTGVGTARPDQV